MGVAFRPAFSFNVPRPSREVLSSAVDRLGRAPLILRRTRVPGGDFGNAPDHDHLVLTVVEADRHFWSPWLAVEVEPQGAETHVFGRFSPHPSVWTGFMFGYLALTVILMFSLVFAFALSQSKQTPWPLGVSAGSVVVMVLMWWASQLGQRLARAQMEQLRGHLESSMDR